MPMVVEAVESRPPENVRVVEVALFGKRYANALLSLNVRQILLTAKQPEARLMPVVCVDVAVPVWLKLRTERPPLNVDVAVVVAFTVPK